MTYQNRELIRKPVAMIRGHEAEMDEMDFLVEYYGGVSRAEAYRLALLEMAREKRHEMNSLSSQRMSQSLDGNGFTRLRAAA